MWGQEGMPVGVLVSLSAPQSHKVYGGTGRQLILALEQVVGCFH